MLTAGIDKDWLAQRIAEHELLANITGRAVNRRLLNEVRLEIAGTPEKRQYHRVNGYVVRRKVTPEEMEKLWR